MPLRQLLRGLLVSAALPLLPIGCTSDAFGCLEQEQCGNDGQCEPNGYCSFPDASCDSGRRFADNATDGVANVCVPVSGSTGAVGSGTSTNSTAPTTPQLPSGTSPGSTGETQSDETGGSGSGYFGTSGSGGFLSTTADETGSTGLTESGSTGPQLGCAASNPERCLDCFECADTLECTSLLGTCEGIPGCDQVNYCLSLCEAGGLCFDDCCEDASPAAVDAALSLSQCHQKVCQPVACIELASPLCTSPG